MYTVTLNVLSNSILSLYLLLNMLSNSILPRGPTRKVGYNPRLSPIKIHGDHFRKLKSSEPWSPNALNSLRKN